LGKRAHSNRKLHSLPRLLRYGDQNGYGKRLEEEAEDQEGKSGEKKKAQGETLEEVTSSHTRAHRELGECKRHLMRARILKIIYLTEAIKSKQVMGGT